MMATGEARTWIDGNVPGGEDIRPPPCLGGMRVFPRQRMGQVDLATALRQILLRQGLDSGEVVLAQRGQRGGKGGEAVLVALARADSQWLHLIINVFDPEPNGCHDAEPAPLEQFGHQLGGPIQESDDGSDFVAGHHHGNGDLFGSAYGMDAVLQRVLEDTLIEEHQGIHRLVLGRGSDIAVHGQIGQERLNLGFRREEVRTRLHAVETNEADDPLHIGALGVDGVVMEAEYRPDFLEECWWLTSGGVRPIRTPSQP